ncbi:MAG: HAMP domain-containing protein [Nitrospirae bacterium]|nr:HAMP domain-containing protein [Nitrospirota bacterium]
MNWLFYHIGEEYAIALICFTLAVRVLSISRSEAQLLDREKKNRLFLLGTGFAVLGISSLIHATIHTAGLDENILYQTLLGYCLGLLTLIVAVSAEKPWRERTFPLLYLPLLALLYPGVYERFPIFGEFRPLVWIIVSYLSGVVCMIYIAAFYNTRLRTHLHTALGHALICISAVLLFFPAPIGSAAWIYGHLFRPVGFGILFFSMTRESILGLKESMLYRALTAFSLLAAIPLLVFGMVVFYENISPIHLVGRRLMVFLLLLITLASALLFGLGLIIRLIRPLLNLKDAVDRLAEEGFNKQIEVQGNDEIGELSRAFNDMVVKLSHSLSEQDRLSRLAATGELAATLAHEIKNPLNAIGGAALYIQKNFRGSLIREFLKVIYDEVARINKLTTTLLDFAKPVKPEPRPSDINKLVMETLDLLRQESEEQGIMIETRLDREVPEIPFDYHQIKQVLINLLINSFDAVEKNGKIKVRTAMSGRGLLLSVEDNGKGIGAEDMENIFNPFFTTRTRGTGLGLAISRKIAKEHGGDIMVESAPGKGSTFTLFLPLKR